MIRELKRHVRTEAESASLADTENPWKTLSLFSTRVGAGSYYEVGGGERPKIGTPGRKKNFFSADRGNFYQEQDGI